MSDMTTLRAALFAQLAELRSQSAMPPHTTAHPHTRT